ncbi:FRG domain-containing protein [Salinimonas sp. HHU 13199]|uniref:FRG domain-containing protein n=1 Tax=Salinimonas profundi TaxID=2729140 RepID=A0ABR8LFJ9_9ALTE|nr:FRG domain-containing protein [Salinimonas profundi]MBD3585032.1 FRG domain-containing protein [Salinimonas profundi]
MLIISTMQFEQRHGYIQNTRPLASLSDFVESVALIARKLDCDPRALWFRGVESSMYRLTPVIMRSTQWRDNIAADRERTIFDDFVRRVKHFQPEDACSNRTFCWYTMADRFGIPTRLLHWSTSPLIALYFAIWQQDVTTPTVWVLNPNALNEVTLGHNEVFKMDGEELSESHQHTHDSYAFGSHNLPDFPIAVANCYTDATINAHRTRYTVSGKRKFGLEDVAKDTKKPILMKIRFGRSEEFIHQLKSQLSQLGASPQDITPGIEGIGRAINFEHSL